MVGWTRVLLLWALSFLILRSDRPDASSFTETVGTSRGVKKPKAHKKAKAVEEPQEETAALAEVENTGEADSDSEEPVDDGTGTRGINDPSEETVEGDTSEKGEKGEKGKAAETGGAGKNKMKRLRDEGKWACYNEMTVLGDLNDDGEFSPQEWYQMFQKIDSASAQRNWKISEDEWREFLSNCDFGCFQEYANNKKESADENLDWWEWKNAMKLMDQGDENEYPDFSLEKKEIDAAGLAGYSDESAECVLPGGKKKETSEGSEEVSETAEGPKKKNKATEEEASEHSETQGTPKHKETHTEVHDTEAHKEPGRNSEVHNSEVAQSELRPQAQSDEAGKKRPTTD